MYIYVPPVNFCFLLIGEYHHYDMVVYPKKVAKSILDIMKAGLKVGLKVAKIFANFSSSSTQTEGVQDADFYPKTKEKLAAQCLHFYLEPYKNILLHNTKELKVDFVVTEIANVCSVISAPCIDDHKQSIPEVIMTVSIVFPKLHVCCAFHRDFLYSADERLA